MPNHNENFQFEAKILCPVQIDSSENWAFIVLPKAASAILPRRGRTSVTGKINGQTFQATLEPDGQLSHWLKINSELLKASGVQIGDIASFAIMPIAQEPEPEIPTDFEEAISDLPLAKTGWNKTTVLARMDWIHWITSAKQSKTRSQRIKVACDKLASGELRVCCFDISGYYSKAFSAPIAES